METLRKCLELLDQGTDVVLVTVLTASAGTPGKPGFKLVLTGDGRSFGTVGGGALEHQAAADARKLFESRTSAVASYNLAQLGMRCGGAATLSFEFLPGARGFVLFGAGHLGRALAPILESLGFRLTLFDSRPEVREAVLAAGPGSPEAARRSVVIGDYTDLSPVRAALEAAEGCFIATHGHQHDYEVLKQVLACAPRLRYLGLIGSRTKIRTTHERLKQEGIAVPDCLFAPVGRDLGAQTPAEIAVAIAAEIVALRYGKAAPHLRENRPADRS